MSASAMQGGHNNVQLVTMHKQCTTSGQSNLITGHIAAAHGRFDGICQVVPVCSPN